MYVHLGEGKVVPAKDIIAIFSLKEGGEIPSIGRPGGEGPYETVDLTEGKECCSCVLTDSYVYLSPISAVTIRKRAMDNFMLNFGG